MLTEVLDLLTVGVILVDASGRFVFANASGQRMLDAGLALERRGEYVTATNAQSAMCLRNAIGAATAATGDAQPRACIATSVIASDGQDLVAWVLPVGGTSILTRCREGIGTAGACAAIFVRELSLACDAVPVDLLARRYGLTPAECRVLLMLARGMTPAAVAGSLGTSQATTKTHIARLFQKTGTRRQADLVRLVMSALAPVHAKSPLMTAPSRQSMELPVE